MGKHYKYQFWDQDANITKQERFCWQVRGSVQVDICDSLVTTLSVACFVQQILLRWFMIYTLKEKETPKKKTKDTNFLDRVIYISEIKYFSLFLPNIPDILVTFLNRKKIS